MIRRIKGKGSSANVPTPKDGNIIIINKRDICNKLAETLAKPPFSDNYVPKLQKHKELEEENTQKFKTDNTEDYNKPFFFEELQTSVNKPRDTAVGPDNSC